MPAYLCLACGVQYADTPVPPDGCPVCADERQYVPPAGQRWTTVDELAAGHRNVFGEVEPGLTAVRTEPTFGIGQRALLVATPAGGLLWDCLSLVDDATVAEVHRRGGLAAVAVSHPHFYGAAVAWSEAFDGAAVWVHEADRAWFPRPGPAVRFWTGASAVPLPGLELVHLGGHFAGAAALHWPAGSAGRGALLSGDTVQVGADRRSVSVMYSYPNYIPVSAATVRRVADRLAAYRFETVHGAFGSVPADGGTAVARSLGRYAARASGTLSS